MSTEMNLLSGAALELWAGAECSVARVGDVYRDQLVLTGHHHRLDDLERLASLGVKALRFPVIWERIAPEGVERADWSWTDVRLERLRALGIRPILGLVHHGSGPKHTSLLHGSFAEGLARFAQAVAERYPWVEDYTPVNEPLTTARFSGLYGHWFPHKKDDASFVRALYNQCRAVALAMQAVRTVNPAAKLVQTEDIGTVFASEVLTYQAAFENARRWLSLDLLGGRVEPTHPLHGYLRRSGLSEDELGEARTWPAPDLIGVNYYVTSDRLLDDRVERHHPSAVGGNGRHRYADVEAVRAHRGGILGHQAVLEEVWRRYRSPLAITEAHLGCTREEQIRWLSDAWLGARRARDGGADVRAVTLWSAFGAVDWDSLLRSQAGRYEPGAFDVRGPSPRPTAIARVAAQLAAEGTSSHPLLASAGWWRRTDRFSATFRPAGAVSGRAAGRPVVVTGAKGRLGRRLLWALEQRGIATRAVTRLDVDIADARAVGDLLDECHPWAVINAAGSSDVAAAETTPERCLRDNVLGPATLAESCGARAIRLVTFSSHWVFAGDRKTPYLETHPTGATTAYGRSHAEAERKVQDRLPESLIIRSSLFFGDGRDGLIERALLTLAAGDHLSLSSRHLLSATYLPDLVEAALDLLVDGETGIWHLVNPGLTSPLGLARAAAQACGLSTPSWSERSSQGELASISRFTVLGSERHALMPSLEDALARFARDHRGRFSGVSAA